MADYRPVPEVEGGWKFPRWLSALVALLILGLVVWSFLVPAASDADMPTFRAPASAADQATRAMLAAHKIQQALYAYALANHGLYPAGHSSTEVFQKLLDGHYVTDPRLFFLATTGKTEAGTILLTPANVAFDVTVPMDIMTPAEVPAVFTTGCQVEYKPGGRALPRTDHPRPGAASEGLIIAFPNGTAVYRRGLKSPGGVVTDVIPVEAQIGPGPFTQLTPEGDLPAVPAK